MILIVSDFVASSLETVIMAETATLALLPISNDRLLENAIQKRTDRTDRSSLYRDIFGGNAKLTTHGLQKQLPGLLTEIFESKSPTTEIACKKSRPMINQVAST